MQEQGYNATATEAVGVFNDVRALQAAIDDLLSHGFDHAEISVLASESAVRDRLGHSYRSTRELEDDPEAPRVGYVADESVGGAQGAIIGTAAYFPAVIGSLVVIGSGGTLLGAVAVAALAGGTGAALGATLAKLVGNKRASQMQQHIEHGGVVLWVRTHDTEHEKAALEILGRNRAEDVHLHTLAEPSAPTISIPTRRPFLSMHSAG